MNNQTSGLRVNPFDMAIIVCRVITILAVVRVCVYLWSFPDGYYRDISWYAHKIWRCTLGVICILIINRLVLESTALRFCECFMDYCYRVRYTRRQYDLLRFLLFNAHVAAQGLSVYIVYSAIDSWILRGVVFYLVTTYLILVYTRFRDAIDQKYSKESGSAKPKPVSDYEV